MPFEDEPIQPDSLLQDVTIPPIEQLGESVRLFFSGQNPIVQASDPGDEEVNRFISGAG